MWMLLERVRFTLDGIECNKIGISYEAFNRQPNFCASPFWSCLHNQLWNFREVSAVTILKHPNISHLTSKSTVTKLSHNQFHSKSFFMFTQSHTTPLTPDIGLLRPKISMTLRNEFYINEHKVSLLQILFLILTNY